MPKPFPNARKYATCTYMCAEKKSDIRLWNCQPGAAFCIPTFPYVLLMNGLCVVTPLHEKYLLSFSGHFSSLKFVPLIN